MKLIELVIKNESTETYSIVCPYEMSNFGKRCLSQKLLAKFEVRDDRTLGRTCYVVDASTCHPPLYEQGTTLNQNSVKETTK